MDIIRDKRRQTLMLSQSDYLTKVLKTFGMSECRAVSTPLGSQIKLQALTKDQEREQEEEMRKVPYFSAGALGINLTFTRGSDFKVRGYCDSDYASDLDKSRSTTGYVYTVGGNTVSWRSSLQKVVALSTTEAEYMALSDAVREGIWLKGICKELKLSDEVFEIHCDSQRAIYLAKNFVYREKTKHIATKYNFIREVIAKGVVNVLKIHTLVNPADMLTKALPGEKFDGCLAKLKVIET
ncbi:hypothetical protein YC2023_073138 [Brassica napus]